MKKIAIATLLAVFTGMVLAVTIHAMGNLPTKQADCSAKFTIKKTDGSCECKKTYVWDDAKSKCAKGSLWCQKNFAKRSAYFSAKNECACRKDFELSSKGDACVKVVKATEVTLDDSDNEHGSAQYDFETGQKTVYGSPDLFIGGIIFDSNWMPALNWQVVEMSQPFNEVAECPATGYASVTNVDEKTGFGSPIYAQPEHVYCLKTSEGNYAKLEILSAYYDTEKELRILKFKYVFQPNGSKKMP
jgi:hypothetical protein